MHLDIIDLYIIYLDIIYLDHIPRYHLPKYHIPRYHIPRYHLPRYHIPRYHIPIYHIPRYHVRRCHIPRKKLINFFSTLTYMLHSHVDKLQRYCSLLTIGQITKILFIAGDKAFYCPSKQQHIAMFL